MSYSYDHDCPFEAFITNLGKYNEGELTGEWVKFPTTPEKLQEVFERIGIGSQDEFGSVYEEWFISDYDCYVDGLYDKLGEYESLDELNYLASKLEELGDAEYEHFQAAMQISDYTGSIKDLINLTDNLDKYDVLSGVEDYSDLGRYYIEELGAMEVPEHLRNYIDYEAYGRDIALDEVSDFTDYGYVYDNQDRFVEYYDGDRENIPEEYRVMVSPEEPEVIQEDRGSITFYAAECMEFPTLGEYHENLTLQEAVDRYRSIPAERMNGIKGIGFTLEDGSIYSGMSYPLVEGRHIDLDGLSLVEHFKESPLVREAVADIIRSLPDLQVDDQENYLKNAEITLEDDYGMIDGIINNGERRTDKEAQTDKPSVLGQLSQAKKECAERKPPETGKLGKEEPEL